MVFYPAFPCSAYEAENAVPLHLETDLAVSDISEVDLALEGRQVTLRMTFNVAVAKARTARFLAHTPMFEESGVGEEHADKTFSDLRVTLDGRKVKTRSSAGGFFDGKDITGLLASEGISPLPGSSTSETALRHLLARHAIDLERHGSWRGMVSKRWTIRLRPATKSVVTVTYEALPEFSIQELGSQELAQLIDRHCGDVARVIPLPASHTPEARQFVLVERYDIPLPRTPDGVSYRVAQPIKNWLGARPVTTLACGTQERSGPNLKGRWSLQDLPLSMLVISALDDPEAQ